MKYTAILVLLSAAVLGACAPSVRGQPSSHRNKSRITSICSLVGADAPTNGAKVRIRAFFLTDYLERSVVADPACPAVQLALYADPVTTKEQADRYQRLVVTSTMRDYIEDHRTGVYAIDVTGRFIYRKDEQPHGAIYADHVLSLRRMPCTAFYSAAKCKEVD